MGHARKKTKPRAKTRHCKKPKQKTRKAAKPRRLKKTRRTTSRSRKPTVSKTFKRKAITTATRKTRFSPVLNRKIKIQKYTTKLSRGIRITRSQLLSFRKKKVINSPDPVKSFRKKAVNTFKSQGEGLYYFRACFKIKQDGKLKKQYVSMPRTYIKDPSDLRKEFARFRGLLSVYFWAYGGGQDILFEEAEIEYTK